MMLYLMSTPRVYNKLKMIVSEAISSRVVSSPIKQEEAKAIPYLQVRRAYVLGIITSSLSLRQAKAMSSTAY